MKKNKQYFLNKIKNLKRNKKLEKLHFIRTTKKRAYIETKAITIHMTKERMNEFIEYTKYKIKQNKSKEGISEFIKIYLPEVLKIAKSLLKKNY